MSNEQLEVAIESAWENRDAITPATQGETREAIEDTLNALDSGSLRVAQKLDDGSWHVNQWAKKAVLLGFRIKDMEIQSGCLLYTSPSPRDRTRSRMPSSA